MTCLHYFLIVIVVIIFYRSMGEELYSKKLGGLSVACLMAVFVPVSIASSFKDPDQLRQLVACGVITIVLGVASVVLALWALRARRHDRGLYRVVSISCIIFSAVGIMVG